jgi:hypothetical protein
LKNKYCFDKSLHIHLLDDKPLMGTSTALEVLSKPLTWWASGKALELLGWTPTKTDKFIRMEIASKAFDEVRACTDVEYLKLLDKAYRNHKDSLKKSADKGTDLHAEIERFIKGKMSGNVPIDLNERILPFIEWSDKNVKRFLWSEAHCYSENLWCGGISDFGVELNNGLIYLGDIKSSKEAYTSHFLQGGGYCLEIKENGLLTSEGDKIRDIPKIDGLIIVPFGAEPIVPQYNMLSLEVYENGFKAILELYKLIKSEEKLKEEVK